MEKDLIIHANGKGIEIALLENGLLAEYHIDEQSDSAYNIGDIYLGKIKKINPGLNAAFVDVGHNKDAFIHYTDLSPSIKSIRKWSLDAIKGNKNIELESFKLEPETDKEGNINDILKSGDRIITQILKEPISTKGPRLVCEISIPGRFAVLVPFNNSVGISKKIVDKDERKRLSTIIEKLRPKNYGIVLRTNASGVEEAEIRRDIINLLNKWKKMSIALIGAEAPKLLLSEIDKSLTIIRDLMNDSFNHIITDNDDVYSDLQEYMEKVAPDKVSMIKKHKSPKPIFEQYKVNKQLKTSFGKAVTLKSGAYLIIEHTEALHVIDVNSGPKINQRANQDENAFSVNQEAALEIARQLRLRDIGGIIVVDFIDMKSGELRQKLFQIMSEAMKDDKARHTILPLSKFGLMEITRQRVKPAMKIDTSEPNPDGNDRIESALLLIDKIELDILHLWAKHSKLLLYVHPFIQAYLTKGIFSIKNKWCWKFKKRLTVYSDSSLNLLEYHIKDTEMNPIK
jgi:ribonuclease G